MQELWAPLLQTLLVFAQAAPHPPGGPQNNAQQAQKPPRTHNLRLTPVDPYSPRAWGSCGLGRAGCGELVWVWCGLVWFGFGLGLVIGLGLMGFGLVVEFIFQAWEGPKPFLLVP